MMLCTNKKREFRVNGSNANNKMCFEVRAPSSTSPPSPRRISNTLTCPPRTPTENFANTTGSIELLSQPIQPPPRQYKWSTEDRSIKLHQYNQIHLTKRDTSTNSNSTSPRGSKPQPQPLPKRESTTTQINLYQRGIQQERVYNKVVYFNHKPIFPQTNDPSRIG